MPDPPPLQLPGEAVSAAFAGFIRRALRNPSFLVGAVLSALLAMGGDKRPAYDPGQD